MKQKLWTVFLTALLALCISFGLAACGSFGGDPDDGDNGDDTTIVTPGDLDDDPDTPGDPDEEPETPHEHTYTSAVTKEPTCTQAGEMTYTCTCGDSYTESIPMTAHTYVDGVCSVCGEHEPTEGLVFTLPAYHTQYSVTDYTGTATEVYIPSTYNGRPVTSIGDSAFYGCSRLTSITIPDSVTRIGEHAFGYCSRLTSITIPDSVTNIWNFAFDDCSSLTSIEIPDSVIDIGDYAFGDCYSLTNITLPDSVTSIGWNAFANTAYYNDESNWENDVLYLGNHLIGSRTTLSGGYTIKQGTKVIADEAFRGCSGLTSITIPDSVTNIGYQAFCYCRRLASIMIGDGVISIGNGAFLGCDNFTNITVSENNVRYASQDGILYNKEKTKFELIPQAIQGEIFIPGSVTSIEGSAFEGCSGLTSVIIGNGMSSSIGSSAFEGCSGLTSITLPDSVTSIGSGAFRGTAYYNDESNWQHGVLYIGNHLIEARDNLLGDYIIRQGIKTIANYAFSGCDSLTSIEIPDGITSIGDGAFWDCRLTSITIPDSVTSIGGSAFRECPLSSITFGDNSQLTSIGSSAFYGCDTLLSITIPDSVTRIGYYAFRFCSSLTSIMIPDSVTRIGQYAFDYCESLTSVTFEDPDGWYVTIRMDQTGGMNVSSSSLSNPATAARYLRDYYDDYYWYKR